jgi:hypothetical protein
MLQNRNDDGCDDRQIVVYDNNTNGHESKTDSDDEPPAKWSRVTGEEGKEALSAAVHAMDVSTPSSYEEATTGSNKRQWTLAMQSEIESLVRNQTWDVVPRGPNAKAVGTKWVFGVKKMSLATLNGTKHAWWHKDFVSDLGSPSETYAPVINMNSIRIVVAVCCARGCLIYQLDVDTAFLYGTLDEVVFMEIPDGMECDDGMMLRLNKSLYGLKQAAHVRNKTVNAVLIKIGFKPPTADSCIYTRARDSSTAYICLYVDDMLVAASTPNEVNEIKTSIAQHFRLKDLVHARFILVMEVQHNDKGQVLTVPQYIRDVTSRFNQMDTKRVDNPCESGMKLSWKDPPTTEEDKTTMVKRPYRSLVWCLLYIATATRPDACVPPEPVPRRPWPSALEGSDKGAAVPACDMRHRIDFQWECPWDTWMRAYSDADWGSNVDHTDQSQV